MWARMRPRRIVMLTPYTDPIKGGISSYTRELAAAYARAGTTCVGFAAEGKDNAHFRVIRESKPLFCVRALMGLLRSQPDLIHAHSQHWYVLLTGAAGKILRPSTPLIVTLHTPAETSPRPLVDGFIKFLLRLSDGAIFVSKAMKHSLRLPASIRQGVIVAAPEQSAMSLPPKFDEKATTPTIVFAGPLVWSQKVAGVLLLVDAFARVSPSYHEWRLTILGDGPLRGIVEQRVRDRGLSEKIVIGGFVNDVFEEIARAAIYAQISLQEGLPLALLDAMALGTAVIATTVGGIPEVVRHNETGYLVEPQREAIAAGLHQLMGNERLRRALAMAAKKYVSTELSWDKVAHEYLRFVSEGVL